jgi:hypothetical protein
MVEGTFGLLWVRAMLGFLSVQPSPEVELLWWEGCPSWQRAAELVREVMREAGFDPQRLRLVQVATVDKAQSQRFVGSPTIRINGVDVQPPAEDEPAGLTCRIYHLRNGKVSPLPDVRDVRDTLAAAMSSMKEGEDQ